MNMFAGLDENQAMILFDENQAMTLQDIKETKRYGRMQLDARTDNVKTVYPLQTKFKGGITNKVCGGYNENSIPITNKVCRGYNDWISSSYH